jgi:hypothetical protein
MAIPATIDVCERYLFADVSEMVAENVPEIIQKRLLRLRDLYNYWVNFPSKKDMDIAEEDMRRNGIGKSAAYDDVRILKKLLGNFAKTTKDYHRYKFTLMIDQSFEMAKRTKDAKAMTSAANFYAKYTQLDKEDEVERGYDQIVVQPFEPTDDPTVLGLKPIPNLREKIARKLKQYWSEDMQEVSFESAEFDKDKLFNASDVNTPT